MDISGRHPIVAAKPPAVDFPVFSLDTVEVDRSPNRNVTCVLPATATEAGWYRIPPWTGEEAANRGSHFVRVEDAEKAAGSRFEIPHSQSFTMPRFALMGFGRNDGWRFFPRAVADLTGDGRGDLVGFGDDGVWTALGDGRGGFTPARFALAAFGQSAGGWDGKHSRHVVDLTGDLRADLLGCGDDGVWTALGDGAGGFAPPTFVLAAFGSNTGWTGHRREVVDLTGDGRPDILGFGADGFWVALNDGSGGFHPPQFVLTYFDGCEQHFLADVNGDGRPDVLGLGQGKVVVATFNPGAGTFDPPVTHAYQPGDLIGGAWDVSKVSCADLTGDGYADLLFHDAHGPLVAHGDGSGGFAAFRRLAQWPEGETGIPWGSGDPPTLADLTGNGAADLVYFAPAGVWVTVVDTAGPVELQFVAPGLGSDDGWYDDLRVLADLTGDGRADIVGFGDDGVWTMLNQGEGQRPRRVVD